MRDILIHLLSVKGFAKPDVLVEASALKDTVLEAVLAELLSDGLTETTRMGTRLSETGKALAATQLAEQRDAGDAAAIEAFYTRFDGLNRDYKAALARWQMREGDAGLVPNDHTDAQYDREVMGEMFAQHQVLVDLLRGLNESWPLLAAYGERLTRAKARIEAGEQRYVAAPLIDSYHTAWFELHEALIRFSGRNRSDEAAAGRGV